jgi:acetyl esterase/lipase
MSVLGELDARFGSLRGRHEVHAHDFADEVAVDTFAGGAALCRALATGEVTDVDRPDVWLARVNFYGWHWSMSEPWRYPEPPFLLTNDPAYRLIYHGRVAIEPAPNIRAWIIGNCQEGVTWDVPITGNGWLGMVRIAGCDFDHALLWAYSNRDVQLNGWVGGLRRGSADEDDVFGAIVVPEAPQRPEGVPGHRTIQRSQALMKRLVLLAVLALISMAIQPSHAADEPTFTRTEDVIYGRKYGTALTMDVFRPKKDANGAGVVMIVSGGYFSSHEAISPAFAKPLLDRGYTVFAVVHGSQPRYTIPEIVKDMNRSVRFIRHHAKEYGVDPNRLGVTGASAGGHLSLMLGTAGTPGNPDATDPVERESSRVQAVGCFFPPTDWLNYGAPGKELIQAKDHAKPFRASFDYREVDKESNLWVAITDPERLRQISRENSPITYVTADDPPTLIIHGDADTLVPLQQSETILARLKSAGVEGKLVVKPKLGHGWLTMAQDMSTIADWFDAHLKESGKARP